MAERRQTNRRLNTTKSASASRRNSGRREVRTRKVKSSRFNVGGCIGRIILLAIVCLAIFFFLQSNIFTVKTVEVRGSERIAPEDIVVLSGIETDGNLFNVDRGEAKSRILLHAAIQDVSVNTRPLHKILITVKEREAVAWIHGEEGYYLMDENGYLFIQREKYNDYLPLITGLELPKNLPIGIKLTDVPGLEDSIEIAKVFGDYYRGQLRELHFTKKENFVFFIGDLKVRLGQNTDMRKKKSVLDDLLQQIPAVALSRVNYIDVSSTSNPVINGYNIEAAKEKAKAAEKAAKEKAKAAEKAAKEKAKAAENEKTNNNVEKNAKTTEGEIPVDAGETTPNEQVNPNENTTTTPPDGSTPSTGTNTKTPVSE